MQLTPREFDKLLVYMMADVALKSKAKGLKLNDPEAVAIISAIALDGARAGKTIDEVTNDARIALTKATSWTASPILFRWCRSRRCSPTEAVWSRYIRRFNEQAE